MNNITKAAIKIFDYRQKKELIIPCHRHSDVFFILHEFGYKRGEDYKVIEQGFLDANCNFLNRRDAYTLELKNGKVNSRADRNLYSEDLW